MNVLVRTCHESGYHCLSSCCARFLIGYIAHLIGYIAHLIGYIAHHFLWSEVKTQQLS
jgi:hypothetical protein